MKEKILVLRYRFIGDTILTVPFLRNLRKSYPEAIIHLVLAPLSGDVLKGIPYVNHIFYWDPPTIHGDCLSTHRTIKDKIAFIQKLRNEKYTQVYILKRSFASALMGFLTGAPKRIGFKTEGRGLLLTHKVPYEKRLHEVRNFLNCLAVDRIPILDDYLEAWIDKHEQEKAVRFLKEQQWQQGEPFCAIHPFASIKERSWPLENFIELANHLYHEKGWPTLWLGGKKDVALKSQIVSQNKGRKIIAIGDTPIRESMAILSLSHLFIGNDSGLMHLAAALHIPLIALFGPQLESRFGPWGAKKTCRVITKAFPCRPCRQIFFKECQPGPRGRPLCLESISIEDVLKEIEIIFEG